MRKLTKSLALVVWNELPGCEFDIPRLPTASFQEVYAIDGGSTDGTVEYLERRGIPVHRQRRKSLNAAYASAVEHSRCEAVVVFFPKGTIAPGIVDLLAQSLDEDFDLVIASRNIAGARNEEDSKLLKPRKWGVLTLSLISSVLWRREGPRVHDVLHGVKGFTVDAYRQMKLSDTGVTIDLEMVVRSYRLRIPRVELPVSEQPRDFGATRFKIWATGKRLAFFVWSECFRHF